MKVNLLRYSLFKKKLIFFIIFLFQLFYYMRFITRDSCLTITTKLKSLIIFKKIKYIVTYKNIKLKKLINYEL